jgi:hypothetical protein
MNGEAYVAVAGTTPVTVVGASCQPWPRSICRSTPGTRCLGSVGTTSTTVHVICTEIAGSGGVA